MSAVRRRGELVRLILETLRCGRQRLTAADFGGAGGFRYAATKCGLVQHALSGYWLPGLATYAAIERHVADRLTGLADAERAEWTRLTTTKDTP